ncbi:MAG: hypothetical protein LBG57_00730 [Treponema sp.]|jgi:hypothetical protein|nr:hypothetical protein [Treponema sp.]
MRIAWNTVGEIVKRVHNDIQRERDSLFDGLVRVGIDETSYKKGHGKAVLDQFFALLTPEQRAGIQLNSDGDTQALRH